MHTAKPGDRRSLQPVRSFRAQDNLQTPAREGVGDNMKTVLLRSAFLSLAVLGTGISLQSQNNSEFAHLSGTLTDANGGGIADVQVQARRDGSPSSQTWSAKSSAAGERSEEHTSELQSRLHLVCRLLLEKKNTKFNSLTQQ